MSLKEIKSFMPRLNCKISTNNLREIFNEVDTRRRNEIGFDDYANLYHKIIFDENVISFILLVSTIFALLFIVIFPFVFFAENRRHF